MKRIPRWMKIVGLLVLVVGGFFGYRAYQQKKEAYYTASCANHFIQLRLTLLGIAEEHPNLVLPSTGETLFALREIFTSGGREDFGRLDRGGIACPESFRRDGSIGYVYIGDGLTLGNIDTNNILILFCPGENHRGSSEHCHAWNRANGICVLSNAEMISELEMALRRGRSGEVPYSKRAMTVLQAELVKRKNPR